MKPIADAYLQFRDNIKRYFSRKTASKKRGYQLAVELMEARELLAASFLAAAEPAGSVNVQLAPLANVTAGVQEIVTFGVPFTQGSVTAADLAKVRVLKNGVEIPAFVEQLTPWRSIDNASVDGQSVRFARIQISYTFSALTPEKITVQWGGPVRTLNVSDFQDPRLEWHTVTSGSFVAADNVEEPDVLPILPAAYLAKGMLDARTDPTNSNVAETRDDPAVMDSMTFSGFQEFDSAQKNFFYTIINQNPGIAIDYKTQAEPWLYDRASAMYELYFRSGFGTALREAVQNTDFYLDHLDSSGFFTLKPGDPKYAYNESLAYTYWLLGDNRALPKISTVVSAHSSSATRWSPNLNFFTERNAGYKLLANEVAYEVTGNTTFKSSVQSIVNDLIYDQNGAGGQLPANRIDGGLYHTGAQHDISEVSSGDVIIASSWMSVLVVDPMVRVYGVWQNSQVADFIVRMGNFEKAASKTDANGQFGGTTRYPDYLMRADGTTDNRSDTDVQHAMDVGAVAAWATYFAELRGTPDASLRQLANDLYATYDVGVNFWTRPGGTNFNVSPPRRYAWEYKNSASFSWALTGTDTNPQPGTLQFSNATYSVNESQSSISITVNRINGSSGTVSVNYATSNGSATAGSDYTATSGTLTLLDGETSKTFTIPIINDTAVENDESVNLTLTSPTGGASLGNPSNAVLTIVSDDVAPQPGALQFSMPNYTVNETQATATITVTRTNGSSGTVTVAYATSNGSATAGSDYTATTGTLTFANGETSKTFTIPIINDTAVENPETVNLTLSNVTGGATLGSQSTAVLTINSDDTNGQPTTATFQQGVNGYTGTTDVVISTQYAQYNQGNGTTFLDSAQLGVYQTIGSGSYQSEGLIRFGNLGIPTNATVSSAAITINLENWAGSPTIRGYYLSAPWNGASGSQIGWIHRGTGQDWATPGALGQGTDLVAGKSFVVPGIKATGPQSITINLDPAVVQAWINNPSADQGILLVNETPGAIVRIGASENTTVAARPKLSVSYTVGAQTPQPGTLQFSNATYTVNENSGTATITVTRTGGSSGSVSVAFTTSDGTATAGSDYTATNGTLTFADGETSKTFTVPITDDLAVEGDETINLTLSGPTGGASLGGQTSATLTIVSNDTAQPGVLQFSTANYTVNETQGTVTITVTRTGGSNVPVTIDYATSNGTATAGSDYAVTNGTLTFAVGETSKTFAVSIINDSAVENAETVTLTLSNPTGGAALGTPATATLTINSDDTSGQPTTITLQQGVNGYGGTIDVSISTQYAQYTSGNGTTSFNGDQMGVYQLTGTGGYAVQDLIRFSDLGIPAGATVSGATLTLNVYTWNANPTIRGYYLLAPWNGAATSQLGWIHRGTGQDWATQGALGQGADVIAGKSFLLSGITGTGSQNITVNLDTAVVQSWVDNPNADQGIMLVNETPGAVVLISASENATAAARPKLSVTYTVGPQMPQPGTLQFNSATYSVNENGGAATVTVTRTGGSSGSVSANYATSNGTATAGSDYTATSGTLTFADGETSKTFTVPIANDSAVEGNETINLTLSNPTGGATLGSQATATLTIQDDDVAPQPGFLQFNAGAYSLNENGGTLTVTVTRAGGTSGAVSVNYATSNGTATAGADYTAVSGTLTFADGQASKTFTVAVLDDSAVEGNETLTLTLSNPTGGATLGSPASATFTILDNDSAPGVNLPTGFTQSTIATGLNSLTALAAAPDGRIFVLEQGGNVRVIKNGALLATPAFTVQTIAEQERGLIGITVDPNFATNHFVYVTYTVGGPSPSPAHNRVSRFTLNGDVAVPGSEMVLIDLPEVTSRIHNGGALKFGGDGKLYLTVGNDNVFGNSQSLTNPFGKVLRINPDGTIPTDNPFFNQTTGINRAIWAYGLRNPYTFDIQPGTGLMYINDVGEAAWEEIDQGVAGGNYGWPDSEGYTTNPLFQSPVYAYSHGTGTNQGFAIVGGAFYNPTNATFPSQYAGKYFFADFVNGWISFVDPAAPNPKTPTTFASNIPVRFDGGPVDLEVGTDGALYYLDRFGGGVFKIQYTAAPPPTGTFTKVNASSGIDAIIAQKYQEDPNWWLSGEHLVDLDNDGDQDLFLDAHNGSSVVALNNGHGVFTRVTSGTWPATEIHEMFDINGDGKVDLNATFQDGGSQWWINHSTPANINFTPTNVTRDGNTSRGQVLFDFNGDGKVDWFRSAPPGLVVDFGDGNGGFTEGSLSFTIPGTTSNENANFLPGDYDGDGDIDLLILTGGGYDGTVGKTAFWRNNGNMTFTDITASSGLPANGTLVKGIGDFDQDGDIDLIATENKTMPPVIYLNDGHGVFTKKPGAISGVAAGSLDYAAWGTAISTDIDNDGIADIIMDGKYYLKVLRGTGGGNFTYMNNAWGIMDTAAASVDDGLCIGDIDGDGRLDIIGYNETFPSRTLNVYHNDLAPQHYLNVKLVGLAGNVGAAGATISIYAAGTTQLLWFEQVAQYDFQVATSYYGSAETERHFGLGTRTNVDIVVRFPSGKVTRLSNVAADQTVRVLESAGI